MPSPTCATCPAFISSPDLHEFWGSCRALPEWKDRLKTHSCMLHPERAGAMVPRSQRGFHIEKQEPDHAD